jgi:hypothetical protein
MRSAHFGLSTVPVADLKSVLRLQIERDLLALAYRNAASMPLVRVANGGPSTR